MSKKTVFPVNRRVQYKSPNAPKKSPITPELFGCGVGMLLILLGLFVLVPVNEGIGNVCTMAGALLVGIFFARYRKNRKS